MTKRDGIIEKVKKLLNLADSTRGGTEAEVMLALQKAQQLMAAHDIAQADLESSAEPGDGEVVEPGEAEAFNRAEGTGWRAWESTLTSAVEKLTATKSILYQQRTWNGVGGRRALRFVGRQCDVALAAAVWPLLRDDIARRCRRHYGGSWNSRHSSFALGFAQAIYVRSLEAPKPTTIVSPDGEVTALTVVDVERSVALRFKREELAARMFRAKLGDNPTVRKHRKGNIHEGALLRGQHEGHKADIPGRDRFKAPSGVGEVTS